MSRLRDTEPDDRERRRPPEPETVDLAGLAFTRRELLDFLAAWLALSFAFAAFLFGPRVLLTEFALVAVGISLVTSGTGFVFHELAHKVIAVRYGQVAHFRANYGMLFFAVVSALAGFLFAAPGAVHHRGVISWRQTGLIALAGPATNLALAGAFGLVGFVGGPFPVGLVGQVGVTVNAFLAAFNLVPYGPLDGQSVFRWNKLAWAAAFVPAAGLTGVLFFGVPGVGDLGLGLGL